MIAAEGRSRLVLSETAGVYEQIGEWTYGVNPFDIEQTAAAMAEALAADRGHAALLAAVGDDSPQEWVRRRLAGTATPGWGTGGGR